MKGREKNLNNRGLPAQAGFVKTILIVVGALVLLKYAYSLDVIGFLTEGRFKELLDRFYELGSKGWLNYKELILKVWNFAISAIKALIDKIK